MRTRIRTYAPVDEAPLGAYNGRKGVYPFDNMGIGVSFAVPYTEQAAHRLRIAASRAGKRLKKGFSVIVHRELETIEIGRIR